MRRETFEAAIAGLTPDPSVPRSTGGQPEFEKPLQTYYAQAVTAGRLAKGRALAAQYQAVNSSAIEGSASACRARFASPRGAWRAISAAHAAATTSCARLATLAYVRPDRPVFRDEFAAALLIIIDRGEVARQNLVGSWAGAMGDPQFLPSAYLKYAVSAGGRRRGARHLDQRTGHPRLDRQLHATAAAGRPASRGSRTCRTAGRASRYPDAARRARRNGRASACAAATAARAGGRGVRPRCSCRPARRGRHSFLLFANYFVIKQYNNSDSYALSLGSMAQRIAGAPAPATPWPTKPINLSRKDKAFIQGQLAARGLYEGTQDGKLGPKARDAIHAYQTQAGLRPADGFATPALLASLRGAR